MAEITPIESIINPGNAVETTEVVNNNPVLTSVFAGNEVHTTHNTVPQVQTIIQDDVSSITNIIYGDWDVVWSVNGQTGDVLLDVVMADFIPHFTYQKNAVIHYLGKLYRAIDNIITGDEFNPEQWEELTAGAGTLPYTSLERLGSYLYRISFENIPEYDGGTITPAGCSSLVSGGKLYRNLDWYYDESPTFLVQCKGFMGTAINNAITDTNLEVQELAKLPSRMTDGINDYGIMTSAHVLYNDWDWHGSGTKTVPLATITYHILTKVKSMETIEDDLADIIPNISVNATLEASEYLMQFVITDGTTTYVLTPPTTSDGAYSLVNITENPKLTNFRWVEHETVVRNADYMQDRPTGVERWNEMTEDFSQLRFTKCYEQPTRLSEFIGLRETTKDSTDAELMEIYETAHAMYLERERDGSLWQTTHSVIYSQKGLEALFVQENWHRNFAAPAGEKGDKGDTGDTGPQGPQGPAGADGLTTSVSINSTTHIQSGGNINLGNNYVQDANYIHTDNNYTTAEKNDVAEIDGIVGKIPTQATASNQLADKDFVNSSINSVTAFYITIDVQGTQFATKAQLDATTVFYSGGEARTPTRNDYCIVLADETKTDPVTGESPTTRYIFQNNHWEFQYVVNKTTLTAAQLAAVNSGITAAGVTKLSGIQAGAEVNVQTNWNQTDNSADDFLKNKPNNIVYFSEDGEMEPETPWVETSMIVDGAVSTNKLANNSVTISKILMQGIFDAIYPVGSIYASVSLDTAEKCTTLLAVLGSPGELGECLLGLMQHRQNLIRWKKLVVLRHIH